MEALKQYWFWILFFGWLLCHSITEKNILVWEVLMWGPAILVNLCVHFFPKSSGLTQDELQQIIIERNRLELVSRGITVTDLRNQELRTRLMARNDRFQTEFRAIYLNPIKKTEKVNWLQEGF